MQNTLKWFGNVWALFFNCADTLKCRSVEEEKRVAENLVLPCLDPGIKNEIFYPPNGLVTRKEIRKRARFWERMLNFSLDGRK